MFLGYEMAPLLVVSVLNLSLIWVFYYLFLLFIWCLIFYAALLARSPSQKENKAPPWLKVK